MKHQLIKCLIELDLLISLFYIENGEIKLKKEEIISILKDINVIEGTLDAEKIKSINAIREFDKKQCQTFIKKNLKILFYDKEL